MLMLSQFCLAENTPRLLISDGTVPSHHINTDTTIYAWIYSFMYRNKEIKCWKYCSEEKDLQKQHKDQNSKSVRLTLAAKKYTISRNCNPCCTCKLTVVKF